MHIIIYSIIVLCATMIGAITGLGGALLSSQRLILWASIPRV